ncbi:hypothetical protein F5Y00DRAFT_263647 [Daldinia vernicosa]|uniref:uncharacterized protein n=1 Tax=Daldinia vernicosa TaxID=114800 RepID=UPI002008CFF0|nr:uncharacterized protein F5Y00DRAFT_263647 [Daldinia vernicosa]KAI0847284.1 hypothetical protein F5Y00DRAFT_263647 [Daldinia vernicosa]
MTTPNLQSQSPAVDFIENHSAEFHSGFMVPASRYDFHLGAFIVTTTQPERYSPPNLEALPGSNTPELEEPADAAEEIPSRPLAKPAEAMKFWDAIFPLAMAKFGNESPEEPKNRIKTGYSIRNKKGWKDVYDQLERARAVYTSNKGIKGFTRKIYRGFAEGAAQPTLGVIKLIPDNDYLTTPVLGAVQVILESAKFAAKTRKEILSGFDDLDLMFSEVELFIETFPRDENIQNASVDLVVAVLAAVESVIGFLIQHSRALAATFNGKEYQSHVKDHLERVKSASANLIRQASNSKTYNDSHLMQEILARTQRWREAFDIIKASQQHIQQGQTRIRYGQSQLQHNQVLLGKEFHQTRNLFCNILKNCVPELLSNISYGISSVLSNVFSFEDSCLSLGVIEVERRAYERLNSIIALRPKTPSSLIELTNSIFVTRQYVLDLLNTPDLPSKDLEYINSRRQLWVSSKELARAESLVQEKQVKEWLVAPESSQLLIHGGYEDVLYVSGLSLFCASAVESLIGRAPNFVCLYFFCGLHLDDLNDKHTGGLTMLKVFICQILCQYDIDTKMLAGIMNEDHVKHDDILELSQLLRWLVAQLPNDVIVFWFIDGAEYYERKEFELDFGHTLTTILDISVSEATQAVVKVLVTSPTRTFLVQEPFRERGLILNLQSRLSSQSTPSRYRLERQLGEEANNVLNEQNRTSFN